MEPYIGLAIGCSWVVIGYLAADKLVRLRASGSYWKFFAVANALAWGGAAITLLILYVLFE